MAAPFVRQQMILNDDLKLELAELRSIAEKPIGFPGDAGLSEVVVRMGKVVAGLFVWNGLLTLGVIALILLK